MKELVSYGAIPCSYKDQDGNIINLTAFEVQQNQQLIDDQMVAEHGVDLSLSEWERSPSQDAVIRKYYINNES